MKTNNGINTVSIDIELSNNYLNQLKVYLKKESLSITEIEDFIYSRIKIFNTRNFGILDMKIVPRNAKCTLRRTLTRIGNDDIRVVDFIIFADMLENNRIEYIRGIGPITRAQLITFYLENFKEDSKYDTLIKDIHDFFRWANIPRMISEHEVYNICERIKKYYFYE